LMEAIASASLITPDSEQHLSLHKHQSRYTEKIMGVLNYDQ